jgi:hypothetical protein
MFIDHTGCLWLAILLAFGLTIVWNTVLPRFFKRRVPKNFSDWTSAVEEAMHRVASSDLAAVEAKLELAELIGTVPKDFDPVIWMTLSIGQAAQRAALIEAERMGAAAEGTCERLFGIRPNGDGPPKLEEPQLDLQADSVPSSEPPPTAEEEEYPFNVRWIGRELHHKSVANR